jgi:hypothetical protein
MTVPGNAAFLDALNGTLTNATALASDMPQNLRDAADVYSKEEITAAPLATAGVDTLVGVKDGELVHLPSPTVYANAHGAVPDCTGQGVGTDVIPAIQAAVTEALALYGNGATICLLPGRYRASTSAVLDLGGKYNVTLDLQGRITSDTGARVVLTVQNGINATVNVDAMEGGIFNGWGDPAPFGTTSFMTADDIPAAGGQTFLRLRGLLNYKVNARAWAYAGRFVQIEPRSDVSHPQTQAAKLNIETSRNVQDTSKARTAQSLYAFGLATSGIGNWGQAERITNDFDYYPPKWRDWNDIEVGTFDTAYASGGPEFEGCIEVHLGYAYIGDIDGTSTGKHLSFKPSATRPTRKIFVDQAEFLNAGYGLYLESVTRGRFVVGYEGTGCKDLVEIYNCVDVEVDALGAGGERLGYLHGASLSNCKLIARSSTAFTDNTIYIHSDVGGFVDLETTLVNATSGKAHIAIASTSAVIVVNNNILSAASGANLFDLQSTNNVMLFGGRITGSATTFKSGNSPISVIGVPGLTSFQENATLKNGGNSAGSGGALGFGISANGLQAYSPMAMVKGKLVNSAGTELQGTIALQVRPNGGAGQVMTDAVEVKYPTVNGHTALWILCLEGGVWSVNEVLRGAAGTGPGGSGKALYTA